MKAYLSLPQIKLFGHGPRDLERYLLKKVQEGIITAEQKQLDLLPANLAALGLSRQSKSLWPK